MSTSMMKLNDVKEESLEETAKAISLARNLLNSVLHKNFTLTHRFDTRVYYNNSYILSVDYSLKIKELNDHVTPTTQLELHDDKDYSQGYCFISELESLSKKILNFMTNESSSINRPNIIIYRFGKIYLKFNLMWKELSGLCNLVSPSTYALRS